MPTVAFPRSICLENKQHKKNRSHHFTLFKKVINLLMSGGNEKLTHNETNLQLKAVGLSICDLFIYHQALKRYYQKYLFVYHQALKCY